LILNLELNISMNVFGQTVTYGPFTFTWTFFLLNFLTCTAVPSGLGPSVSVCTSASYSGAMTPGGAAVMPAGGDLSSRAGAAGSLAFTFLFLGLLLVFVRAVAMLVAAFEKEESLPLSLRPWINRLAHRNILITAAVLLVLGIIFFVGVFPYSLRQSVEGAPIAISLPGSSVTTSWTGSFAPGAGIFLAAVAFIIVLAIGIFDWVIARRAAADYTPLIKS